MPALINKTLLNSTMLKNNGILIHGGLVPQFFHNDY
jgi:hypothetical protein